MRVNVQLELPSVTETVTVAGGAQLVDTSTNALGRVVTGRELVDLPLNGRNFTQLGLLQTGVAPLTAGVATAGGSLRQGQAYAVNGMRPEQNIYLVDGAQNMNRMDGGYALKLPVEAIAEFRILTQSAPPEYGGTGGATTSVVTRSGSNQFHGSLYEFLRNDAFDARNFFSAEVEPLKQHQFGGTVGGPIARDRVFFFGYYEGFRNKQGMTTTATVPTAAERQGDFSGMGDAAAQPRGRRRAVSRQPDSGGGDQSGRAQRPRSVSARQRLAVDLSRDAGRRRTTSIRSAAASTSTCRRTIRSSRATPTRAATTSTRSRCAAPTCPGFPTRDDLVDALGDAVEHAHPLAVADQLAARHVPAPQVLLRPAPEPDAAERARLRLRLVERGRAGAAVLQRQRLHADRRRDHRSAQHDAEHLRDPGQRGVDAAASHLVKVGGEFRHTGIDMFQAIAPNAFFVFAGTFPTNNAIANLLLGAPVTFYQGLGDFNRGVRVWGARRLRAGRVARQSARDAELRRCATSASIRSPRSRIA